MTLNETAPHIAILPSPGFSHLIPAAELAERLVLHHNFHVTFIIPTSHVDSSSHATTSLLQTLPAAAVDYIFLPPVSLDDLPKDTKPGLKIPLTVIRSLPSIRQVLKSLTVSSTATSSSSSTRRLVAFLADPFAIDAFDVAKELNVPSYVFFPSNTMVLSLLLHLPKLDGTVSSQFLRDLPDPVKLPGCVPVHGKDLIDPIQDRKSESYKFFLHMSKRLVLTDGIIVNSFVDLESEALKALQEEEAGTRPPIYPVGPIIQTGRSSTSQNDGSECLTWLDNQPRGSVLYVSFGSGGTLSHDQLTELAFGLEMSGQKFIWVVRRPNNDFANAAYLGGEQSQLEPRDFLPDGFLEKTEGRGLVVPSWAPQVQVLNHGSTGGFVSHCGWSSTLESIAHGVPLIAWPLFAEQKMNAVMLVEGLKVALRPKAEENGLIRREEIAKVLKVLMEKGSKEGQRVRDRVKDLRDAAAKALSKEGSSTRALFELASTLNNMAAN